MRKLYFFFLILFSFFISKNIFAQSKTTSCPCCTEQHRQFDFWVGHWQTTANGKIAGTNHIILLQDSCIIQENWISTTGNYTGTSYNFFNKDIQKWQQLWIDNQGVNLILIGERIGNQMVMKSKELVNAQGEPYINRITWTKNPDGTVRQNWEVSKNSEKTWTSIFDGLYQKKKSN